MRLLTRGSVVRMANIMPPLPEAEYQALKASIQKNGVLVPVEVDEDTGELLDGHHRMQICQELGIEAPVKRRKFSSDKERKEHALTLNLMRRQLGPISWAESFKKLAEVRGVELRKTGPKPRGISATVAEIADEVGVPERTARYRMRLAEDLQDAPDLALKVDKGEMEAKRALRVKREREVRARTEEQPPVREIEVGGAEIRHCDFRDLDLPESSVDLIFTDPPYPAEYLPLWQDLSHFAASALKPTGLLVAYSGQYHLPAVMESLGGSLDYLWTGTLVTPGQHNQVQRRKVRSAAKPLLFYKVPDSDADCGWIDDAFISEGRNKEDHDWQQSLGAALYYIEKLTEPGAVVVDPFLGSGTTAVACKQLGRSFIGCDLDEAALSAARKRLAA